MTSEVLVLGAGVIGLTTAITLAEAGRSVRIRTKELPLDSTSAVAGALLGPIVPDGDGRSLEWMRHGDNVFRRLAADSATGVRVVRGRLLSKWGGGVPAWATAIPGYAPCTGDAAPEGFGTAFWVSLPIADMRRYLAYLIDRLKLAGGTIEIRQVHTLAEAAEDAALVVNCTGVGAVALTGDEDLHPVLGQHVIVANPGLDEFAYEGGGGTPTWAGYFPHADRVVLGGVGVPHAWRRSPDPAVTEGILQRNEAIEPRLKGAEVLGVEVGLRPARSTVRIEAEQIGDATVVHHYGHGGNGVQWSWGSARDAAQLALDEEAGR